MGLPVVSVASGGLPIVESTVGGTPVTEAANGRGVAVTKVAARGLPVVFETIGIGGGGGSFATFDGTPTGGVTVSNGGRTVIHNTTTTNAGVASLAAKSAGKYYFEVKIEVSTTIMCVVGIMLPGTSFSSVLGLDAALVQTSSGASNIYSNGNVQAGLPSTEVGDVYGMAVDLNAKLFWIRENAGNWNANASANPATGVGGFTLTSALAYVPFVRFSAASAGPTDQMTGNFGASTFANAAPVGFGGWPT